MATTIDALVVTLGLDPKAFTDGQKKAMDAFKKSSDEAKKRGNEFEEQARRSANYFSKVRNEAIGLIAALAGAYGIKQFIGNMVTGDAAVNRFARTTGMAVKEVSAFDKAVSLAGGAEGAGQQALAGLNDQIQAFRAGLGGNILPIYNQMAAEGGKVIDINKGIIEQFLAIAQNARAIEAKTPGRGGFFLRQLGINEDTINVLIRGNQYMQGMIDKAEKLGAATEKDAAAAEQFLGKWRTIGQLLQGIFRPLESILEKGVLDPLISLMEKIEKNQKTMEEAKPADRPKLGKERLNNILGTGVPTAFGRFLDWFGPDDVLINAIFGEKENRTAPATAGAKPGGQRERITPYLGGAFGGLNYKPMGWDQPSSSSTTEINVNGPITITTQATDANGIARDLRSGLEALAAKRRMAVPANSGQE